MSTGQDSSHAPPESSENNNNNKQQARGQYAPTSAQVHDGPPSTLNIAKLRGEGGSSNYKSNDAVMSPTTSVKALLADTNAAPPPPAATPSSASAPSSSSTTTATLFEQQQAALRKRQTATSSSSTHDGEQASRRQLGDAADTLVQDVKSNLPAAPLIDGRNKPGATSPNGSNNNNSARPTFQQTLQDLRTFLLHFLKALPFKGLQNYLKKIIGPIVRLFVRGVAKILHRGQFGLASNLAFDIQLLIWKWVINLFFREIRPRGAYKLPRDGPLLLVAGPHHNQFLDPLLLMSEARLSAGRRVSFLIAEKSYHRSFVGLASKIAQSIPVARAADNAKTGKGTIYYNDPSSASSSSNSSDEQKQLEEQPIILSGSGTNFTKELGPKYQIQLGKQYNFATVEVVKVIDDEHVQIKKMFNKDKIVEDLKKGLGYKCLPYIDQTKMYSAVYQKFSEGGCIGIFPEGGSHDRTDFLPLKHGLAIMALGAMAANPECKVKIVPVGLNYFHPHRFRSRAVIEFGAPISIPEFLVQTFAQGGQGKRDAIGSVMDLVYDGLKSVTVRADDFETLMVIQASRRLYKPPGQQLNLSQVVELNKRFIMGYNTYRDEPKVQQLYKHVEAYNKNLQRLGLKDHQVEAARRPVLKSLLILLWRTGLISAWTIMALPGIILNAPIFIAASTISRKKAKEAVAASTVKLQGRDVLATWKVLVSLGMAPVLYSLYTVIAMFFVYRYHMGRKYVFLTPLFMLVAVPSFGYSALRFGEVGMDIYKSLPPLFMSLFPWHQKQLERIRQQRRDVTAELTDCIEEFAPRLWKDFESHRIIPPSSDPQHSYPTSSLESPAGTPHGASAKRKSTFGAESSILQHPMSWIDEKVFGWSTKSGRRRWASDDGMTSDANTPMPSEPVTPAYKSEGEQDTADYDEVVRGVEERLNDVNSGTQPGPGRLRRRSSARSKSQLNLSSTAPAEDPVESNAQ